MYRFSVDLDDIVEPIGAFGDLRGRPRSGTPFSMHLGGILESPGYPGDAGWAAFGAMVPPVAGLLQVFVATSVRNPRQLHFRVRNRSENDASRTRPM